MYGITTVININLRFNDILIATESADVRLLWQFTGLKFELRLKVELT